MWDVAGRSEIGGRTEQEDRIGWFAAPDGAACLLAVADGMGGHEAGAFAADLVIAAGRALWADCDGRVSDPQAFLSALCLAAHRAINEQGRARGWAPRSTCAFLLLDGESAHWCHVGDSRLYQFRNGTLVRRTRDHSVVQMLVDTGEIGEGDMAAHPDQNKLFRSLGGDILPEPSFGSAPTAAGDGFVLCSDGLWERIPEEEMAAALQADDLDDAAGALAAMAVRRGGASGDNVSVILIRPARAPARAVETPLPEAEADDAKAAPAPARGETPALRAHRLGRRLALATAAGLAVAAVALLALGPFRPVLDPWLDELIPPTAWVGAPEVTGVDRSQATAAAPPETPAGPSDAPGGPALPEAAESPPPPAFGADLPAGSSAPPPAETSPPPSAGTPAPPPIPIPSAPTAGQTQAAESSETATELAPAESHRPPAPAAVPSPPPVPQERARSVSDARPSVPPPPPLPAQRRAPP